MLDFLSKNTVNAFLYEDTGNRGLSSAVDNAMAVKRPVAISNSTMFRHLFDVMPSVCVKENSLSAIIKNGFSPLQKHYDEWSAENQLWEYERIVSSVLYRRQHPTQKKLGIKRTIESKFRNFFSMPDVTFTWLRNSDRATEDNLQPLKNAVYNTIQLPADATLTVYLTIMQGNYINRL